MLDKSPFCVFFLGISLIGLIFTGCNPVNEPKKVEVTSTRVLLPDTWTPEPSSTSTQAPATITPVPSWTPVPTDVIPADAPYLQADPRSDYWLVTIENARALSLQKMHDGSFLLFGLFQTSPYQELPLLIRFSGDGRVLWQKTLEGFDPGLATSLPGGGILLVEKDFYLLLDNQGELKRIVKVSPGPDRVGYLGFEQLQSIRPFQNQEIAVMDSSGIVSFFDHSGNLIRQEYSDIYGNMSKDWMRLVEIRQAIFYIRDDKIDYGYKYREYTLMDNVEGEWSGSNFGFTKLRGEVLPSVPPYFMTGLINGYPILGAAVEGNSSGVYDIWIVSPTRYRSSHTILPGTSAQSNFYLADTRGGGMVLGSSVRLYNPVYGRYLRLVNFTRGYDVSWDILFGDGIRPAHLAGGFALSSRDILLVGEIEKEDRWGSDLFILKTGPEGLIPGCEWLQPGVFGDPREGVSIGGAGSNPPLQYHLLDFELDEIDPGEVSLETVQLLATSLCVSKAMPTSAPPSPTFTKDPPEYPAGEFTWTPTPTASGTPTP